MSRSTKWVRATRSGILHLDADLGDEIAEGDPVATIYDPFGKLLRAVPARTSGMIIGHTQHPLVNRGDAIVHIADVGSDVGAIETAATPTRPRRSSQDFS